MSETLYMATLNSCKKHFNLVRVRINLNNDQQNKKICSLQNKKNIYFYYFGGNMPSNSFIK